MKTTLLLAAAVAAMGLSGLAGFYLGDSKRQAHPLEGRSTVQQFAESGIASAQRGDSEMAVVFLRRASKAAGTNLAECQLIWGAISRLPVEPREVNIRQRVAQDFLGTLGDALLACDSVGQLSELYRLRTVVTKSLPPSEASAHHSSKMDVSKHDTNIPAVIVDPEDLFEQGAIAFQAGQLDRADLLTQAALRAQSHHPSTANAVWNKFRPFLDKATKGPRDRLERLLVYRTSVETAMLDCGNVADFEQLWAVRNKVAGEIDKARSELAKTIQVGLVKYQTEAVGKKLPDQLATFAASSGELEPQLVVLLATKPTDISASKDADLDLSGVTGIAQGLLDRTILEVQQLEKKAEEIRGRTSSGGAVEKSDALGLCEQLLQDIQTLSRVLQQAQLNRWLTNRTTKPQKETTAGVVQRLALLYGEVAKLQQLRYNIWALQRISAAETVGNWDTFLGEIDTGRLEPTVHAIYSSTYETRIRQRDDPQVRAKTIQSILAGRKITPAAF